MTTYDRRLLALLLCCCGLHGFPRVRAFADDETAASSEYERCEKLQPQESIRLRLITGSWYVIEILQHRSNDRVYSPGEISEVATCPTVTIRYPAGSDTELNLYWKEDEGDVDYRFRVNESLSPGKWESAGAQTGLLSQRDTYMQFAGTVFVRKAVIDHMVLTFCSPGRQLYSLVVARNRTLDDKESRSIKSQMKRIKLPVMQTKLACRSGSSSAPRAAVAWLIAALCVRQTLFRAAVG